MMGSEKKIYKEKNFIDSLKNTDFLCFFQCQKFNIKDLQELKNELQTMSSELDSIQIELLKNNLARESMNHFYKLQGESEASFQVFQDKSFSFSFQGPILACLFSFENKEESLEKSLHLMTSINKKILLVSGKNESEKKIAFLLQSIYFSGDYQKKQIFLSPEDIQSMQSYQGKRENLLIPLLGSIRRNLIAS